MEERSVDEVRRVFIPTKKAYDTIADEAPYSDLHTVNHLVEKMMPITKLQAIEVVKGKILDDYQNDFNGAILHAKGRITSIYKDEIAKLNKFGAGKRMRAVYETQTECGGHARGRHDQRGGGKGNQGGQRGGEGGGRGWANNYQNGTMFGGIDVSDATHDFTAAEWDQIGTAGRAYVNQERKRINSQGRERGGRGRSHGYGGYGGGYNRGGSRGGGQNINEVTVPGNAQDNDSTVADSVTFASRGGRSGAGFGRGAHGNRGAGNRS